MEADRRTFLVLIVQVMFRHEGQGRRREVCDGEPQAASSMSRAFEKELTRDEA